MSASVVTTAGLGSTAGMVLLVALVIAPSSDSGCASGAEMVGHAEAAVSLPTPSANRTHPVGGSFTVSDVFGARGGTHKGVDFAAPAGTPILAAAAGRVVAAGPASGFGNWIVVDSVDEQGQRFSTVYGHMFDDRMHVRVGDQVTAGQHIADVGSAGESTGPHLHFEVVPGGRLEGGTPVDPIPWLAGAATPGISRDQLCTNGFGAPGANLAPGKVPPELEQWFRRGGSLCPQISASLLAAQDQQESGFVRGLTSPAGARGLAQFLPDTAKAIDPLDGQPFVIDADGNGAASVWDDGDAIVGQARYMCYLASQAEQWNVSGRVHGDVPALALAAYNAGSDKVLAYGGVPPYAETQAYVSHILATEPSFRMPGGSGEFAPNDRTDIGLQIVAAARQWIGTPYVWGGGGPGGPSNGGFDCSGLTSAAVFAATGHTLPRTSEQQWEVGAEVPLDHARPGDLLFSNFGPAGPGHVAIASGSGQEIEAPQPGEYVKEGPVSAGARARRIT